MNEDWTGRIIDGRYTVESVLGSGGMGLVLRARHKFTGVDVALKVLRPEIELDPDVQMRFLGEARAPNAIGHPGIVQVVDAGKAPDGLLYLVMELLTGRSLRVPIASGELTRPDMRRIMMELFDALHAAHARGFVHRDLKPENIFLAGPAGTVKLLDFGIAKVLDAGMARVRTATGVTLGTPAYMAPEQFNDPSSVDARADLWAAGVMIYEMLCGRLPFFGHTTAAFLVAVATKEPTPIRAYLPAAPPELEAFLARALSRDLAHRFATSLEMAQAFATLPLGAGAAPASVLGNLSTMVTGTPVPSQQPVAQGKPVGNVATLATGVGQPGGSGPSPLLTGPPLMPGQHVSEWAGRPGGAAPYPAPAPQTGGQPPASTPDPAVQQRGLEPPGSPPSPAQQAGLRWSEPADGGEQSQLQPDAGPQAGLPTLTTTSHQTRAGMWIGIFGVLALIAAIIVAVASRRGEHTTKVATVAIDTGLAKPDPSVLAMAIDAGVLAAPHDAHAKVAKAPKDPGVTRPTSDATIAAATEDASSGAPVDPYANLPAEIDKSICTAGCTAMDNCDLAPNDCVQRCNHDVAFRKCVDTARAGDCIATARCGAQLACGSAPHGRQNCRNTSACQRDCDGDRSCMCKCAADMAPIHALVLARLNMCKQNCGGKICIGMKCGKKVGICETQ